MHLLRNADSWPINWLALAGETLGNQLSKEDYEKLAKLEGETDNSQGYHTPPDSPMHE